MAVCLKSPRGGKWFVEPPLHDRTEVVRFDQIVGDCVRFFRRGDQHTAVSVIQRGYGERLLLQDLGHLPVVTQLAKGFENWRS